MLNFFNRKKKITDIHPSNNGLIEQEKIRLEKSAELLRKTTLDVTEAATNAAITLEKHLKNYEHRFFNTIDTIDDLVIVKDGNGRWLTLNTVGQDLFNWHHGEYYQKTDAQLAIDFPHLKNALTVCADTDLRAWEARRSNRVEEHIVYGSVYKIFDVIKTPLYNEDGSRRELVVVGRDITELVEKQRRTKACFMAMNAASEGIVIIDSKARIVFSNDEFNSRFGINDYKCVIDKKIIDVLPWLTNYDDIWQQARENKSIKIITKEAGDIIVMPMMNGLPKPIYFICTFKK